MAVAVIEKAKLTIVNLKFWWQGGGCLGESYWANRIVLGEMVVAGGVREPVTKERKMRNGNQLRRCPEGG